MNASDNRDREENANIKTDTAEVSGSSDGSFSFLDRRPIDLRLDKATGKWIPFVDFGNRAASSTKRDGEITRVFFEDGTVGIVDMYVIDNGFAEEPIVIL